MTKKRKLGIAIIIAPFFLLGVSFLGVVVIEFLESQGFVLPIILNWILGLTGFLSVVGITFSPILIIIGIIMIIKGKEEDPFKRSLLRNKKVLVLSLLSIALTAIFITLCILFPKYWFPQFFSSVFPIENHQSMYSKPEQRLVSVLQKTEGWKKVSFDYASLSVPFGDYIEGEYPDYSYDFGDGDYIIIQLADPSSGNTNFKMKQSCFLSYENFEYVDTLGSNVALALFLIGKEALLTQSDWSSVLYYYENEDIFVCQMGDVKGENNTSSVNLILIPQDKNLENEASYIQIMIISDSITQEDVDAIVSSIEIN